MSSRKMGRPTSDPKTHDIKVRISDKDKQKLDFIQKEKDMSKSDIVRAGIDMVYTDCKKK